LDGTDAKFAGWEEGKRKSEGAREIGRAIVMYKKRKEGKGRRKEAK